MIGVDAVVTWFIVGGITEELKAARGKTASTPNRAEPELGVLSGIGFLALCAGAGTLTTRSMPKAASVNPPTPKAPRHLAVIMDGNGRWAKDRGLPRTEGHRRGADAVRRTVEACVEMGVEFLTLYAFSSENWQRPKSEVEALMKLLDLFLRTKLEEMLKNNVRFQAIGRLTNLPARCQEALHGAIARTRRTLGYVDPGAELRWARGDRRWGEEHCHGMCRKVTWIRP